MRTLLAVITWIALSAGCTAGGMKTAGSLELRSDLPTWVAEAEYSVAVLVIDTLGPAPGLGNDPADVTELYVTALNAVDGVRAWGAQGEFATTDDSIESRCRRLHRDLKADAVLVCDAHWNRCLVVPIWLVPSSGVSGQFTYELRDAKSGAILFSGTDSWSACSSWGTKYFTSDTLNANLLSIALESRLRLLKTIATAKPAGAEQASLSYASESP